MPRYFFHTMSGCKKVLDFEGTDLVDLDAAVNEAVLDARSAMSQAIMQGRDISRMSAIDICSETGSVLATVPYVAAIHSDDEPKA